MRLVLLALAPLLAAAAGDPTTGAAVLGSDPNSLGAPLPSAGSPGASDVNPARGVGPIHAPQGLPSPIGAPAAAVNDTLVKNPYAPQFQVAPGPDGAPQDAPVDELAKDAGPEVKVYGPADKFWDAHPASKELKPLFRYWNPSIRDHFYTVDFSVFGSGREGWVYQGIQMYVFTKQVKGTVPLYRYFNMRILDDYYTISSDVSKKTGYKLKGVACYVFQKQHPGTVPFYRYFNQELADHYYTHNFNIMQHGKDGWVLQGIAAYGYPHPHEYVAPATGATVPAGASPDNVPGHLLAPTEYVPPAGSDLGKGKGKGKSKPPSKPDLPAQASADTPLLVPLYRYWNQVYRDHFYTTQWSELGTAGTNGWEYQGVQSLVYSNPQPGTQGLHRYWNVRTLDHFYTTNFEALGKGKDGWRYEGISCYIDTAHKRDNTPLYRYFSETFNDHFYTTRFIGNSTRSWAYEGVQGYVHPSFFTDC